MIVWHEETRVGGPGNYPHTVRWCNLPKDEVPSGLRNSEGSHQFTFHGTEGSLVVKKSVGGPGYYEFL